MGRHKGTADTLFGIVPLRSAGKGKRQNKPHVFGRGNPDKLGRGRKTFGAELNGRILREHLPKQSLGPVDPSGPFARFRTHTLKKFGGNPRHTRRH